MKIYVLHFVYTFLDNDIVQTVEIFPHEAITVPKMYKLINVVTYYL